MIFYRVAATRPDSPAAAQLVFTTQPEHAVFAAELLSLWRRDGLPDHPRRAELLFAVREHDNGWREPDAAPAVDPTTGEPYDVHTFPTHERAELWARAVDRFAAEQPYAALLIAHHTLTLHTPERQDDAYRDFFAALDPRYDALLDRVAGIEPSRGAKSEDDADAVEARQLVLDEVRADYVWLELTDLMSLALCSGGLDKWSQEFERHGTRFRVDGDTLAISPFPLAGSTTFTIRCRTIPDRRYASDSDLTMTLVEARWQRRQVRVIEL